MAFSSAVSGGTLSDINVTPLVDVMLVLLIIFMVTAPLAARQIPIDLPQVGPDRIVMAPPSPIRLRVAADGQLFWNESALPTSMLANRLAVEAAREVQPTLEVDASPEAAYEAVADVLASARFAGIVRIGFANLQQ